MSSADLNISWDLFDLDVLRPPSKQHSILLHAIRSVQGLPLGIYNSNHTESPCGSSHTCVNGQALEVTLLADMRLRTY
jgi:hypothetical protein